MSETQNKSRGVKDITPQRLYALNHGVETTNLTECLAVDFRELVQQVLPDLSEKKLAEIKAQADAGISRRMRLMATFILAEYGTAFIEKLSKHPSDTVRGWVCFMTGQQTDLTLPQRLDAIKPLADDRHFGVREWSWMAVRDDLAKNIEQAVNLLQPWTQNSSEYIRRFATESLRPRGVWCAHIGILKQNPQIVMPLLEALKADPSPYVQDSVANWLNDASKDRADWVQDLCLRWMENLPSKATQRICKRAMRSIRN
ncbi:DNA alkylation repair protein [Paenochrobactrum pullorum]|uniref:DNA alkylation repair protein n=1 Tax=Paenochrobactrum pullorum TaxID=1324351 RepID=UPI0035BC1259